MSDIFREVDEEVRREQLIRLWKQYGGLALGVLGLALIIAGGWAWWGSYQESTRMEDSEAFSQAASVAEEGNPESLLNAMQSTLPELDGGYEILARLRLAARQAESGRIEEAVASYDAIAGQSSVPTRLRHFAQMQAAMALMGHGNDEEVFARLDPLAVQGRPYYHLAQELRGYLLWRQDRLTQAYEVFDELANNASGPPGVRQRASQMREMLEGRITLAPPDNEAGASQEREAAPVETSANEGPRDATGKGEDGEEGQ